jgi:hypothetical protein
MEETDPLKQQQQPVTRLGFFQNDPEKSHSPMAKHGVPKTE